MKRIKIVLIFLSILGVSCSQDMKEEILSEALEDTLLFSKNPKGYNELYKWYDGEESVLLSNPDYDYWWSKVSPDKSKILVYRSPVNPEKNHDDYINAELLLVQIDGSNPQVLIAKNDFDWKGQGVCRWNKDGTKILMCVILETTTGEQWRLVETDAQGKNPKILSDYWAIDCNYSEDDLSVLFMGFSNNNLDFDLSKLELQKGLYNEETQIVTDIVALTQNTTRDHDPAFAPDNSKIVFSGGNTAYSNVDLLLYDVASEEESVLLDDANANGGSMCWSPDGGYVYFHSLEVFKTAFHIKRIHVETKEVETLLIASDASHGFYHPEVY